MIRGLYFKFYKLLSRADERADSSSGLFQRIVRETAQSLLPAAGGRLLDAGCGEGIFLERLGTARPDLRLHGADLSGEMLRRARERFARQGLTVHLRHAEAAKTPFPDNYFDVVTCLNMTLMLGSAREFDEAVRELSRICKPGGTILVDFRIGNFLVDLKYRLAPWYDRTLRSAAPRRTCNETFVEKLFARHGVEIAERRRRGFPVAALAPLLVVRGVKRGA